MSKKSYYEKLKDPRWQKKRLEKLSHAEWRCESCYGSEETLHVHHKVYFKGREPWEYELDQLAVLCEACHEAEHSSDQMMEAISRLPVDGPGNRGIVAALVFGVQGAHRKFSNYHECAAYIIGRRFDEQFYALLKQLSVPDSAECKALQSLLNEQEDE